MKRVTLICLIMITAFMITITACQSNTLTYQNENKTEEIGVRDSINKNLDIIIANKNTQVSSNPTDYIKANKEYYEKIINSGDQGFEFLFTELKQSSNDGLKEWIMAKACEDILKEKKPSIQWASGKDWLQQYEKIKKLSCLRTQRKLNHQIT